AQKVRVTQARRLARQRQVPDLPAAEPSREPDRADLSRALDDEAQRLPEKVRLPILLCYLEGRTREEAARLPRWSAGAVRGMRGRGRGRLRSRLTRHGLTVPATALAGWLSQAALSAAVPAPLRDTTIKAALPFAAGEAAAGGPAALAEGVLQAMGIGRLKAAVAVV